ncbi:type II toxin-antitoxin system VapC family toxin [Sphingosinicella terrae]|uniref:type II toxin-antitoxin system VapC family toxin n=1 Tax=Sphingosinicella terrae TaxID=2172047 RepID=UPI000E0D3814|nr:type II toxin-antitoxin system VapC family toxin [Sphingosinicella terrae]
MVCAGTESDRAGALIGGELHAPDLILAEIANALWKKVRRGEIETAQSEPVLSLLRTTLLLQPSAPLAEPALEVALELGHPVCDCFFLVLARELDVQLVTADARLIGRCRGTGLARLVRPL